MPAERAADRLLVDMVRGAAGWNAVVAGAALFGAAGTLLLPAALGGALDAALRGGGSTYPALARLGAVLAATVLAEILTELADTAGAARTTARLRHALIGRALALGPHRQPGSGPGDMTARLVTGAAASGRVVSALLGTVSGLATAAGALVALALVDWRPAVTLLVGFPAAVAAVRVFVGRASVSYTRYQDTQGEIAERLVRALEGVRTIRASGTTEQEVDRVTGPLPELASAGHELWRAQRGIAWSFALLVPLMQVAVVAVGGYGVAAGRLTPGELVAALGYAGIALGSFEQVDGLLTFAQSRAGARRVAEVVGTHRPPPGVAVTAPAGGAGAHGDAPEWTAAAGALRLRGVTVRSAEGAAILDGVDLDVPAGALVAVVGRSGSGKTTLAALPGRLVEPDSGTVMLDGTDVSTMDDRALRAAVTYAFERPALLGTTVADAVGYGLAAPEPGRIALAAGLARADGFVGALPHGYATPLAEAPLSGGEAQRLGLARALARDAALLVLDDATSNLDTATEAEVTAALTGALRGRTRLAVAHRVTTAARADLVVWLDGGRVRGVAPHRELWRERAYRAVFAAAEESQ